MKISQLIEALELAQAKHGDVEVYCSDQNTYTENGPITKTDFQKEEHVGNSIYPNLLLLQP